MLKAGAPAPAPVIVGGLIWQMMHRDASVLTADAVLSGPAISTALGVAACATPVRLMVAVPQAQPGALRLLRALDPDGSLWRQLPQAPLRWRAAAVIGTQRRWEIEGDPRAWSATAPAATLSGAILALANAAPAAYAAMLAGTKPHFAAIDLDARWAPSQSAAMAACVRSVQLLTVTRADRLSLPPGVLAGSRAGQPGGPVMVIKDGPDGVEIQANGAHVQLPPPACSGPVQTDVGAGDMLLGVLAARLGRLSAPPTLDDCAAAYLAALPLLARLLGSASILDFANAQLALRPEP